MASSPPIYCPLCGAVNLPDATSCVSCGHPLASTPSQQLLVPSALLRQRYRILGQAGAGGFSTVYRAEDTQVHHRVVAVKEISQRRETPEDAQKTSEAFQQEAVLLAGLSHANLPRIHDYFQEGGRWYLVMEFLAGETLEERLRRSPGGRLPVPDALEVGVQLATVLEYLHTRQPPIIFRDLKPANVMLTAPLRAYLIDFGIARLFKPGQSKDTLVIGTIGYLAPEGYGKGQTTPRSDIYSLGVTLHQMLSGADPAEKPFHVAPLHSPVPPALAALVAEMVEMEEGRRPATMTLVRQRLQRMLEGRAANPTDVLPRGIAALSPTQPPDQSIHPYPLTALGPQLVQVPPMPPPIQPRTGGVSRRAVAVGLGLGALVVGVGVVGILRQRTTPIVDAPPNPTTSGTESGFQVAPTSTIQSPTTPAPGLTPTPTPDTQGTVAYPPYRAHVGPVHFVLWSPTNGQEIVSTSVDGTLQVWNPQTLKTRMDRLVYCQSLGWSANGQFFACGLMDNSVLLWNAVTDTIGLDYPSPQGSLAKLAGLFSGKGSAARGMSPRNKKAAFGGGGVQALSWSPDNSEIVSAGNSGTIQVWDASSLKTRLSFGGQTTGVFALAWSPDGSHILSGGAAPYSLALWDASSGKGVAGYGGHSAPVNSLAWSPNGKLFASAGNDGRVLVREPYGLLFYAYTGHSSAVYSVAWSPDGKRIASASQDGTVQLWDATTGANVFTYRGHTGSVNAVAWSKDGKHLASGGDDKSVQVWEAR
ncbi:MAG TPA: protein kinase [Ktedonobacterales bacterium]|jgi:WD40 repeat protein/tRNA A-37 threonylcarbamoyl transferase component Bud32